MIDRTLARFIAVGIGNTLLGLGVIFAARQFVPDFAANLIGYLVVVPLSFLSHRNVSFRDRGGLWPAFVRYLPTVMAGYMANLAVLSAALLTDTNPYAGQTLAIASHVAVTYLLSRYFVFLNQKTQ